MISEADRLETQQATEVLKVLKSLMEDVGLSTPGAQNFSEMTDEEVRVFLAMNKYTFARKLEDGSWVAVCELLTTTAVCTDVTLDSPFTYRWCFKSRQEAMHFYRTVVDFDETPTRRETLVGHRYRDKPLLEAFDAGGRPRW